MGKIEQDNIPNVIIEEKKPSIFIWLIPIIALIISSWLVYKNIKDSGLTIKIYFKDASGLRVNKSFLIYKGFKLGMITDITVDENINKVLVKVEVKKDAKDLVLREGSRFWITRAKLGFDNISGLETILTGAYIGFSPSSYDINKIKKQKFKETFIGIENPHKKELMKEGLRLILKSNSKLSISYPIFYKNINVGEIIDKKLNLKTKEIEFIAFIKKEYKDLVKIDSKFWVDQGTKLKLSPQGLNIQINSLQSLITGGISFNSPSNTKTSSNNANFYVYSSSDYLEKKEGINFYLRAKNAKGINKNSKIFFKGFQIGEIKDISLNNKDILLKAFIEKKYKYLLNDNSVFYKNPSIDFKLDHLGFRAKVPSLKEAIIGSINLFNENKTKYTKKKYFNLYKNMEDYRNIRLKDKNNLFLKLKSKDYFDIKKANPISYKGKQIGEVLKSELKNKILEIEIVIFKKYKNLINNSTKFFINSSIDFNANFSGIKLHIPSPIKLLKTQIEIDGFSAKKLSKNTFNLYKNKEKAFLDLYYINLEFDNVDGLSKFSPIKYKGLVVGEVDQISLSKNLNKVNVRAFLYAKNKDLARKNSIFYIQKPILSINGVKNLETMIKGSYINIIKKDGELAKSFKAFSRVLKDYELKNGLKIKIQSKDIGSITKGENIFYKNIVVGAVKSTKLSLDSKYVIIDAIIFDKYQRLLRTNSLFYKNSGLYAKISLSGFELKTKSIKKILEGGISFVTPNKLGELVKENTLFKLNEKLEEEWLNYNPSIKR